MSKIILDKLPREPKECPYSEACRHLINDEEYFLCHLRMGFGFGLNYTLDQCVGCDECEKITSISLSIEL